MEKDGNEGVEKHTFCTYLLEEALKEGRDAKLVRVFGVHDGCGLGLGLGGFVSCHLSDTAPSNGNTTRPLLPSFLATCTKFLVHR
jgi:hypothetical protein